VLDRAPDCERVTSLFASAQMHRGVARILGRIDEEARNATKALATDLQWEYEDEYDDSFDDLLRTGSLSAVCRLLAPAPGCGHKAKGTAVNGKGRMVLSTQPSG